MGPASPFPRALLQKNSTKESMTYDEVAVASKTIFVHLVMNVNLNAIQGDCLVKLGVHCHHHRKWSKFGVEKSPLSPREWVLESE